MTHSRPAFALLLACGLQACGPTGKDPVTDTMKQPIQCGAEYVAFDAANHRNQDLRLQAYTDMMVRLSEATLDPTLAPARFAEAEALYLETASFGAKVRGRKDLHLAGQPEIGVELDDTIRAGFAEGKAATTKVAANLAKQKVDKTLVHFFFVSVHYEMTQGTRAHWDEAFGYFGAASLDAAPQGLALVAKKRDGDNGTTLREEIYGGIVDGSCVLAKELRDRGLDTIAPADVPELKAALEKVDLSMQKVLAYSAGHEAFEIAEGQAKLLLNPTDGTKLAIEEELTIKLAELDPYFRSVEAIMTAKGGESAARASRVRAKIESARGDSSQGWMRTMDANAIMSDLESEFGIDIRG